MITDDDQRAEERAMASGGLLVFLLLGAHGAVLTWGRPFRHVALAAAVTCAVTVAYVHMIRFVASRRIRSGPFQGLSWADSYRVSDAVARGEAVSDLRLVEAALRHVEQRQRLAKIGVVVWPVLVAGFLLRLVSGELSGRRLAYDILTGTVYAIVTARWVSRMPKIRQAQERTRALHPAVR